MNYIFDFKINNIFFKLNFKKIENSKMKSDLSVEIPSELVRLALFELIEKQLQSKNYQMALGAATKAGDLNFTGIVYRVWFNKMDEIPNGKSMASSIILKIAPQNKARRTQFNIRPAFVREIYTYVKVRELNLSEI